MHGHEHASHTVEYIALGMLALGWTLHFVTISVREWMHGWRRVERLW